MLVVAVLLLLVGGQGRLEAQASEARVEVSVDLRGAVREALATSGRLASLEAGRDGAEADRFLATSAFVPEVSVTGRYTRLSELPESARTLNLGPDLGGSFVLPQLLDQHAGRVQVSLPITDLLYRSARLLSAAGDRVAAQEARVEAERARVAAEARTRYVELVLAERTAESLRAIESRHATWHREVRARAEAGLVAGSDRLEVEAQWLAVQRDRVAAEARVLAAQQRLAVVMGRPAHTALRARGLGPVAEVNDADASATPPDVAFLVHARRALLALVDAERLAALPSVSLTFGVDVAAPHPRAFAQSQLEAVATWDAGVVVSFSLGQALASVARADRLESEAASLAAEERELRLRMEAETAIAASDLTSGVTRLEVAIEVERLARELLALRREEYEVGTLSAAQQALAEAAHLRSVLAMHEAEAEAHLAHARLLETRALVD